MADLVDRVTIRILTVGAPGVGKTNAHMAFTTGKFSDEHIPSIYTDYEHIADRVQVCAGGHTVYIHGTDLASVSDEAENVRERQFKYGTIMDDIPKSQGKKKNCDDTTYVICMYDVSRPETLVALEQKIIPEFKKSRIRDSSTGTRFVIVGCKKDLRRESSETENSCVPLEGFETGNALYLKEQENGCVGWCEISAKDSVRQEKEEEREWNARKGEGALMNSLLGVVKIIIDDMVTRGYFKSEKTGCGCNVQ